MANQLKKSKKVCKLNRLLKKRSARNKFRDLAIHSHSAVKNVRPEREEQRIAWRLDTIRLEASRKINPLERMQTSERDPELVELVTRYVEDSLSDISGANWHFPVPHLYSSLPGKLAIYQFPGNVHLVLGKMSSVIK